MDKSTPLDPGFADLMGLSWEAARSRAAGRGIRTLRIARRGNIASVATADFRTDRLNIDMDENDRVCAIRGLG